MNIDGWVPYRPRGDAGISGTLLVTRHSIPSPSLPRRKRRLLAWLPRSYRDSQRRYPVVYMQDGHNLFDEAASYAKAWRADVAMTQLGIEGIEAIIVGIPNAGDQRDLEYSPWVDERFGGGQGDAYLEFVAGSVKPFVDATLATEPGREATGLAGASLGANLAVYGFLARPDVFGLAAGLSPAFWYAPDGWARLWRTAGHERGRLYLDIGGREDSDRADADLWVDAYRGAEAALVRLGYGEEAVMSVFDPDGRHDETSWRARLPGALRFLLYND